MIKPPKPQNEQARIDALNSYEVLDTESERLFDDFTQLASEVCETPISLISLIDPNRQWFKSKVGLDVNETARDIALCSYAILQDDILEVPDALKDERFVDNPLVTGAPFLRFYAGMPLKTPDGYNIGTLCVIDQKPKTLNKHQRNALKILAREVIAQFELRQKNKKLELANKYKTEFLSTVSHEIRTPLNAIVGLSELALEHTKIDSVDAQILEFIKQINGSGAQLLRIVNSVLDFGKIEAGKMELDESVVDLRAVILKTLDIAKYTAKEKLVDMIVDVTIGPQTYCRIDDIKLSQVLTNIINNAIKFTPSGKRIRVHASVEQQNIQLEIQDQGVGISEQDLRKLFDKYAQFGSKRNAQEGTGLGLSITRGLVALMQGSIEVDSALNSGTCVHITLPFNPASKPSKAPNPHLGVPEGKRAIVVEDNPVNQVVIGAMLNKLGVEYFVLASGEAALAKVAQNNCDFILMDINLPGIDGIQTTKEIKELGITTPVIALTADVYVSSIEKALFDSFLTKPIQTNELQQAILAVLQH
ncbi:ATP-binding protein [Pseudoalteromonas sp. SSDWG2]|uniref:GAF domain-containing hybrid sensor histidine kinase/response regulator n=1 Tax=Pseudoalteromonas sp. SSDWG2 TaxID=3139391 RepID=UPI003BADACA6